MSSIYTIKNRATGNNVIYLGVENTENEALAHLDAIAGPDNSYDNMLYVTTNTNNNSRITTESRDSVQQKLMKTNSFKTFSNSLKKSNVNIELTETYDPSQGFIYKITLKNTVATNIPGNTDICSGKYIFLTDGRLKEQFILVNSANTIATNYISSYRYFIALFIPDVQARYNIGYNTLTRDEDVYTIEIDNSSTCINNNVISMRSLIVKRNENNIANEIVDAMKMNNAQVIRLLDDLKQSSTYSNDGSIIAIGRPSHVNDPYKLYIVHPKQISYIEITKEQYYEDETADDNEEAKYYQIVTDTTKYAYNGSGDISKSIKYQVTYPDYYSGYKDFMGMTNSATNSMTNSATNSMTNSAVNSTVNIINYYYPGVEEELYDNTAIIGAGPALFKKVAFNKTAPTDNITYEEYSVTGTGATLTVNKHSAKFKVEKKQDKVYKYDFNVTVTYDLTKQYDIANYISTDPSFKNFKTFVKSLSGTAKFEVPIPVTPLNKLYYYAASAYIGDNQISSCDSKDYDVKVWHDGSGQLPDKTTFDYNMFMSYKYKKRANDEKSLKDALLAGIEIEPGHTVSNIMYNDGLVIVTSLIKDSIDKINYMGSVVSATEEIDEQYYNNQTYINNEYMLVGLGYDQPTNTKKIQITFTDYTNEEITNPVILSWNNEEDRAIISVLNGTNTGQGYNRYGNKIRALTLKDITDITTNNGGFFEGNTDITNFDKFEYFIGLNSSHNSLPLYSFKECTNLTSIKLPYLFNVSNESKRKTIPENAFKGCTSLETIEIPEYITVIGGHAFEGCVNLKNINLSHVKQIYDGAFEGCTSLTSVDLSSYEKDGNGYDGIIGSYMFKGCTSLTEVILPDNITTIKEEAFDGCTSLYSINLPDSLTQIGNKAFNGCSNLSLGSLPDHLANIGTEAFAGCSKLMLSALNVGQIGSEAFKNCTLLPLVSLSIGVNQTEIPVGLFKNCVNLALSELPANITTIGHHAFEGCTNLSLTSISNNITNIGQFAFQNCVNLALSNLPTNISIIDHYAFNGCTNLKLTALPNSITTIGAQAFMNCTNLALESLPAHITKIDTRAFKNCKNIRISKIPTGVTTIWDEAFYGCESITEIHIPSTVTNIYNYAFYKCFSLSKIYSYKTQAPNIGSYTFSLIGNDVKLYIPLNSTNLVNLPSNLPNYTNWPGYSNILMTSVSNNPVFTVCQRQDRWCTEFENPGYDNNYIQTGVNMINNTNAMSVGDAELRTSIGNAFQGSAIVHFDEFQYFTKVTSINGNAFNGCTALTSITMPDTVTDMGESAFNGCASLTNIHLSNLITSISNNAFNGCISLASITIPDSDDTVTSIGSSAFNGCNKLASITIPDSVTSIGAEAFKGCKLLTSIVIPDSVTSMGESVFNGCTGLINVTLSNAITSIGDSMFKSCTSLTSITIPDSVKHIGSYVFDHCSALTNVYIPDSVEDIGPHTFAACTSLTSIALPHNSEYRSISNYLFESCTSLQIVNIRTNSPLDEIYITHYGAHAFSGCTSLTTIYSHVSPKEPSIHIDDSVKYIGAQINEPVVTGEYGYTFSSCTSINNIYIGVNVQNIYQSAFSGCTGMNASTSKLTCYRQHAAVRDKNSCDSVFYGWNGANKLYLATGADTESYQYWPGYSTTTTNGEATINVIEDPAVTVTSTSSTTSSGSGDSGDTQTITTQTVTLGGGKTITTITRDSGTSELQQPDHDNVPTATNAQADTSETDDTDSTNTSTNTVTNTVTNSISTEEETNTSTNNTMTSTSDDSTTEDTTNTTTNSVSYTEYETEVTNTTTNTTSETEETETNTSTNDISGE